MGITEGSFALSVSESPGLVVLSLSFLLSPLLSLLSEGVFVELLLDDAGGFGLEGVGDDESEQPVKSVQSIAADKRRAANFLFMKIPP